MRRVSIVGIVILVFSGLVVGPAEAKTIVETNTQNQSIDNGKGTSYVVVNFRGVVQDVDIRIYEMSHTFPDDFDIGLVHGDHKVPLMSDVGGDTDVTNIQITFNDAAVDYLPNADPLASTIARPTDFEGNEQVNKKRRLSDFNGMPARGKWKLVVVDDLFDDVGHIGGWEITIKARR